MAATLEARFAHRIAGGIAIDADLRLEAGGGGITVLFGPSGSGKTTVLRVLAGLERPKEGTIRFGDEHWLDAAAGLFVPARRRGIGLLFQDQALFPHLDVAGNVAFGLAALPAEERSRRTAGMLELLGLAPLAGRRPSGLSGGERQRVALARALAPRPRLLLLDEPLSALDEPARARLRGELRRTILASGAPAIVVTHDRLEALALGDRMVVMIDGRTRQAGSVEEIFSRPADPEVARAVGVEAVVPAAVVERRDGLVLLEVAGGARLLAVDPGGDESRVFACLRAEEVALEKGSPIAGSPRNRLAARVVSISPEGALVRVALDAGFPFAALVTRAAREELALSEGAEVTAVVKAPAIHVVPHGGG